MHVSVLGHVCAFVALWTVASKLLCPWSFSGENSGVELLFPPLQGIFLNQKSNLRLLPWQVDSLPPSHLGSPPHFIFTELTTAMSKMSTILGELHTQINPLESVAL